VTSALIVVQIPTYALLVKQVLTNQEVTPVALIPIAKHVPLILTYAKYAILGIISTLLEFAAL